MMKIETSRYHSIAQKLKNLSNAPLTFKRSEAFYTQGKIQTRLSQLSQYFLETAQLFEENERKLKDTIFKPGYFYHNSSIRPNLGNILKREGTSVSANVSMNYSYRQCRLSAANAISSAYMDADVGRVQAKGSVECSLFKKKEIDPKLALTANLSASILKGTIGARLGNSYIYGKAKASGTVGTVYANCNAVVSKATQSLDLGVGASALKGEVELSFHVFGAKVSLTGSGSIGSAEANLSYRHSAKEWEFGSKLGFIAGLGFKVHVSY